MKLDTFKNTCCSSSGYFECAYKSYPRVQFIWNFVGNLIVVFVDNISVFRFYNERNDGSVFLLLH